MKPIHMVGLALLACTIGLLAWPDLKGPAIGQRSELTSVQGELEMLTTAVEEKVKEIGKPEEESGIVVTVLWWVAAIVLIPLGAVLSLISTFILVMLILAIYYLVRAKLNGTVYEKTIPDPATFSPAMAEHLGISQDGDGFKKVEPSA